MAGEIINRTGNFQSSVEDLLAHINLVKTMLWAGDTERAREEIAKAVSANRDLIVPALKFKKELMARRNRVRRELVAGIRREIGEGDNQRALTVRENSYIQGALAIRTKLQTEEEVSLFVTAPVASLAMRLYKMFFREEDVERRQPAIRQLDLSAAENIEDITSVKEHEGSGFRYSYSPSGDGRSETKAYHPEPPSFAIRDLLGVLQETLDASIDVVEKPNENSSWPFWLRAFISDALVELTVFDPGRVVINLTTRSDADGFKLVQTIFSAIAAGQKTFNDKT